MSIETFAQNFVLIVAASCGGLGLLLILAGVVVRATRFHAEPEPHEHTDIGANAWLEDKRRLLS